MKHTFNADSNSLQITHPVNVRAELRIQVVWLESLFSWPLCHCRQCPSAEEPLQAGVPTRPEHIGGTLIFYSRVIYRDRKCQAPHPLPAWQIQEEGKPKLLSCLWQVCLKVQVSVKDLWSKYLGFFSWFLDDRVTF